MARKQETAARLKNPARSSNHGKPNTRTTQSKKRAAERSQNAFKLTGSDEDSDSGVEVKSEDDEEIDSDEAFESGDEDKFGGFKFSGSEFLKKQKPKVRRKTATPRTTQEIDLNEDSVSAVKDIGDSDDGASASDSESQSDFENDDGADLMDLSEMLGGTNHTESITDSTASEDSSAGSESESETETSSEENESSVEEDALENFVNQLQQKRKRVDEEATKISESGVKKRPRAAEDNEQIPESEHNLNLSSTQGKLNLDTMLDSLSGGNAKLLRKTQALQAPLAKPIQDRLNRSAAYDTVKEQITKWQPAVRQMREAAVLKFPLNEAPQAQPNNNSLAASFKPSNELENQISDILKESGMQSEKSIAKFEDIEMAKLSVEEVQKRRSELAIMRDLLFRQEQKAKRQSKIKSKAYRRVHRKEKEKAKLAMMDDDPAALAHEVESRRARERMELRHKNTGKWAQKMLTRADHGEGSRAAITEQLQRGEQLERKIRGTGAGTDEEESENEGLDESTVQDEPLPDKGVFSMKFMRDADAKEAENLAREDADSESASESEQDLNLVQASEGRKSFKPAAASLPGKSANKKTLSQQEGHHKSTKGHIDAFQQTAVKEVRTQPADEVKQDQDYNPWLTDAPVSRRHKDAAITKDTDQGLKFAAKLNKQKQSAPQHAGRIKAPILDVHRTLPLKVHTADSDNEEQENSSRGAIVMKQLDLVSRAFAGDDVVAEFEAAKDSVVAEDAPQDVDETLPGWGSWVGTGVKKTSQNNKNKKKSKYIKHIDGINAEQRKDAKLRHVIINEKRMKMAKPYMSQSVPFPFETKEQYERSLNLPIGPEFTTRTNFQKQIMPRVVRKQGKVVAPMEKPFKD